MSAHEGSKFQENRDKKKTLKKSYNCYDQLSKICTTCNGLGVVEKEYSPHRTMKCYTCNGLRFIE